MRLQQLLTHDIEKSRFTIDVPEEFPWPRNVDFHEVNGVTGELAGTPMGIEFPTLIRAIKRQLSKRKRERKKTQIYIKLGLDFCSRNLEIATRRIN